MSVSGTILVFEIMKVCQCESVTVLRFDSVRFGGKKRKKREREMTGAQLVYALSILYML